MTQKKSNNPKFFSISTSQPCSAAQYAAELVCLRRAEKDNKGSLAYKFWNTGDNYTTQVRAANKLVKKYSEAALIRYLTSPNGSNVYSLGFLHKSKKFVLILKFVEAGVKKAKEEVDKEKSQPKKIVETPKGEYKPKQSQPKKNSLLYKLRKADGNN